MRAPVSRSRPSSAGCVAFQSVTCGGRRPRLGGEGAFGVADLLVAQRRRRHGPGPCAGRAGGELELADLVARHRGLAEGVVLLAGEQVPEQDGELARGGDRGDLRAAAGADALVERAQRPGRADGDQAASTSMWRTAAEPCLEIRPWRAGPWPDWRTRGSRPR